MKKKSMTGVEYTQTCPFITISTIQDCFVNLTTKQKLARPIKIQIVTMNTYHKKIKLIDYLLLSKLGNIE